MALGKDYSAQRCSVARALEIIGERWTLLIVRDCFFGVRRFTDFQARLDIPKAVLSARLAALVEHGVLTTVEGSHGHVEYVLTDKGLGLWPVLHGLMVWGDEHYAPRGPRRVFAHSPDDGEILADGSCSHCGLIPAPADIITSPGPAAVKPKRDDPIGQALARRHQLLQPIRV